MRVCIGHARLDHLTTFNSCVEVSMMKEVHASERISKKRNAAGALAEVDEKSPCEKKIVDCLEYAKLFKIKGSENKKIICNNNDKLIWTIEKKYTYQNKISNLLNCNLNNCAT